MDTWSDPEVRRTLLDLEVACATTRDPEVAEAYYKYAMAQAKVVVNSGVAARKQLDYNRAMEPLRSWWANLLHSFRKEH